MAGSLALLVWLAGRSALARSSAVDLVWSAPPGCPDRAQVLAAIGRLTGGDPEALSGVSMRAEILAQGATFVLRLSWRTASASSERRMESADCAELGRAAALVVALAVGPRPSARVSTDGGAGPTGAPVLARGAESPPGAGAAPAAGQPSVRDELDVESTAPPRDAALALGRASFLVDAGSLPEPATGIAFGVRLRQGLASVVGEVSGLAPQRASVPEGAARLWFGALALKPCIELPRARLRVAPCVTGELALLVGQGQNVQFRQAGGAWFPRFGAGVDLVYALSGRLGLLGGVSGLVAPWRPTFVVQDTVAVYQPPLVDVRGSLGLELRL